MAYESIAVEYYNEARHPTCADFRELSERAISKAIGADRGLTRVVEVGPGRSVLFLANGMPTPSVEHSAVVFLDNSLSMLAHSIAVDATGRIVGEAAAMPFARGTVDLVVASLGDPYNESRFWIEVERVLSPDGLCVFTTPAFDWATTYRAREALAPPDSAVFDTADGRTLIVPSLILPPNDQVALMRDAGLQVVDAMHLNRREIGSVRSDKTMAVDERVPVVSMYSAVRRGKG